MTAPSPLLGPEVAPLMAFVDAGVLEASSVQVAGVIARSVGGVEPEVLLGAALAACAVVRACVCGTGDRRGINRRRRCAGAHDGLASLA